jgi:hypothetical protein
VEAHASWSAAKAACSSRTLNRARPGGVEVEVTGASVAAKGLRAERAAAS